MMLAVAYLLVGLIVAALYGLLVIAVYSPVAYRNGLREGQRRSAHREPSNVMVLPRQRGGAA